MGSEKIVASNGRIAREWAARNCAKSNPVVDFGLQIADSWDGGGRGQESEIWNRPSAIQLQSSQMFASLVTGAAVAAAAAAGYQTMSPTGQWYGRTFIGLEPGTKKLALTYDDGPNDPHTLRLLEVLARHQVRATFFLIGRYVKQRPDIARQIVQAGHVVGNHTLNHPNLILASTRQTRSELQQCEQALSDGVGEHSRLFRPPFGGRRPGTLAVARSLGLEPVMWNVTGWDWKGKSAEFVEQEVQRQVRGGDVILLHDGGHLAFGTDRSQTVIATDRLITRYKSEGYEFLTIPEMMDTRVGLGRSQS
jgi:peptidoglycan-N-acetylglucosamine deacetylase